MIDIENIKIYLDEVDPCRLEGYEKVFYSNGLAISYQSVTGVIRKAFTVDDDDHMYFYTDGRVSTKAYRFVGGSNPPDLLSDLLPDADLDNLKPHEVGLVKLKYGLTQEDIRIPEVFKQFL